jgi:formylglycine-generating enzyme required for sulfatase activity
MHLFWLGFLGQQIFGCSCRDKDKDGDGTKDGQVIQDSELPPMEQDADGDGLTPEEGDCDDSDSGVGLVDADGDGHSSCNVDCDDTDPYAYPGAAEFESDTDCMQDSDEDGYGNATPSGSDVLAGADCDDSDATMTPSDTDSDGQTSCEGDCNDGDATIYVGAAELDNPALCMQDSDGDGYGSSDPVSGLPGSDCDDTDPELDPGDGDGDGVSSCEGDCDDSSEDLDGDGVPDGAVYNLDDEDGDGYTVCDGDLQDDNPSIVFVSPAGPSFSLVTAGAYLMGSDSFENGRDPDEQEHDAAISRNFLMQNAEVTQGQFSSVMGYNPSYFGPDGGGEECGIECPVERLSWNEAAVFANLLSQEDGYNQCYVCSQVQSNWECTPDGDPYTCEGYRLPTEAEWEYAARAGSSAAFWSPFGGGNIAEGEESLCIDILLEDGTALSSMSWYCHNALAQTRPGGVLLANDWGLYDMYGNVSEWVHDAYEAYSTDVVYDPVVSFGTSRVLRGGSFEDAPEKLRSASRGSLDPAALKEFLGFRLARTVPVQE